MPGRNKGAAAKRKAAAIAANEAKRLKQEEEMDPNVEIERRVIDLDELDLQDKQYVEAWKEAEPPQRPPRQKRWKYTGNEIIFDRKKFPKGWNSQEPDLDEMYVIWVSFLDGAAVLIEFLQGYRCSNSTMQGKNRRWLGALGL